MLVLRSTIGIEFYVEMRSGNKHPVAEAEGGGFNISFPFIKNILLELFNRLPDRNLLFLVGKDQTPRIDRTLGYAYCVLPGSRLLTKFPYTLAYNPPSPQQNTITGTLYFVVLDCKRISSGEYIYPVSAKFADGRSETMYIPRKLHDSPFYSWAAVPYHVL